MRKWRLFALALIALSVPACGCADFTITPEDLTCSVDSDCTAIGELHVCSGDPSCGEEHPVNVTAAARYQKAVGSIPRKQYLCGVAIPIVCVQGQCKEITR